MANNDVFATLVRFFSELGIELSLLISDPKACAELLERGGMSGASAAPVPSDSVVQTLTALRDRVSARGMSSLELLRDLAGALVDLVALIQQLSAVHSADDAWNLFATFLDLIWIDRLRRTDLETVALLNALHLLSDDRLLIADLFHAHDVGNFLLGDPDSEDEKANNWSLILGALFAFIGKRIPQEDDAGEAWSTDMLFGWDVDPDSTTPNAEKVLRRMGTMRFTHHQESVDITTEEHFGFSTAVVPRADGGWGLFLGIDGGLGATFPIGQHLELVLEADSPDAINVFFGNPPFVSSGIDDSKLKIALRRKQEAADAWTIGSDDDTHLEIGAFSLGLQIADPVSFRLSIGDGALVIPKSEFGFMGSMMPESGVTFTFDVDFMIDTKGKVTIDGGAGMTVTLPVNQSLLILKVRSITLAFSLEVSEDASASLSATVAFGLDFGSAFKINVDNIGGKLSWALPSPPDTGASPAPIKHGNLGPYGNLGFDFMPPRGIGVQIDAGPIKGGGFFYFDPPNRTYAGVLEASLALCGNGIQIKAAGLLREKDDGWDFVLVMSAQFDPAIEIFLGLSLSGVGGMVGINVSVSKVKLQASLHDGGISELLFPDDPLGNAPAIISMLMGVFPHYKDGVVAGPMLQIGWGKPDPFVTLSVAVVVAMPSPALLLLLGRLHLAVPKPDDALVNIEADFLGIIDFQEPSFSFDASLVHSRITAFPMTGDMAMRAGPPGFLLSIGGFNPTFHPPTDVPKLHRIAIDISASQAVKIRAAAYLAVTSNTFQTGLHASLDIDAHVASIHGWLDFDALVQWEPKFYFSVHMAIGLELRVEGQTLAGVSVDLLLEGPGPWHAKGVASVSILFFTVHAHFETTWGEIAGASTPPQIDAAATVAEALTQDGAWSSVAPEGDSWITFRKIDRKHIGVHPYGRLAVRQQKAPIGIPITRIGKSYVAGGTTTISLSPVDGTPESKPTMGKFAAAQFIDLSDHDKLSRPSFESYQDGVSFGSSQVAISQETTETSSYETVFVPDTPRIRLRATSFSTLQSALLLHAFDVGSIARSGLHYATLNDGPRHAVGVRDPGYRVVAADTLAPALSQTFRSSAAAHAAAAAIADKPVIVVGAHEGMN